MLSSGQIKIDDRNDICENDIFDVCDPIHDDSANFDYSENDDDEIPLSVLYKHKKKNKNLQTKTSQNTTLIPPQNWCKTPFIPPQNIEWQDTLFVDDTWVNKTPLDFFYLLFDDNISQHIVDQTNIYALQSHGKELKLHINELKSYLGILLKLSIFWNNTSRYHVICDAMAHDRFESIKSSLHFNDNNKLKKKDHPEYDKLFKIRPVLEYIKQNLYKIPQEEHQVIDEHIILTKAHISMKQPMNLGYKVISRAGQVVSYMILRYILGRGL